MMNGTNLKRLLRALKKNLKQRLRGYPRGYSIVSFIYRCFRPGLLWKQYKYKTFRKKCYSKFEKGEKILVKSYGEIKVMYEAISPKNYWHLEIGSQYEDKFMKRIFDKICEGDVVLDIGAHTGMYTIPFAKKVGKNGRVYAIEPEKKGFEAIKQNALLNSLNNITLLNVAVSDREGIINFYIRPDKDTHSIFEKTDAPSPLGIQETISVKTSSVDYMHESGVIMQPDFVKIDTEGAELLIVDGQSYAAKKTKYIFVEIHAPAHRLEGIKNSEEEVEYKLIRLGFTKFEYLSDLHVVASK